MEVPRDLAREETREKSSEGVGRTSRACTGIEVSRDGDMKLVVGASGMKTCGAGFEKRFRLSQS